MGRAIKIGFVHPATGAMMQQAMADEWAVDRWKAYVGAGLVCGDGKKHPVEFLVEDTQSSANRAAQVAGDLINNSGVDMLLAASGGDTVVPASEQAEAYGTPCLSTETPWQAWFNGRKGDPKVGFKWTYHAFWGQEDAVRQNIDIYSQIPTNKKVGGVWPNTIDGNNQRNVFVPLLEKAGFTVVDGGLFEEGLEEYGTMIALFRKEGCDIATGTLGPPDMTTFWKQCKQQSYSPKIALFGRATGNPKSIEAMGDIANGLGATAWWTPKWPYKSSLTGETAKLLADDYESKTGTQWLAVQLHYCLFEMAADALKRTTSVDDKQAVLKAIQTMKLDSIVGAIDFTQTPGAQGSTMPVPNVCRTDIGSGQWLKSEGGKWKYDLRICTNAGWPNIPVDGPLQPLA